MRAARSRASRKERPRTGETTVTVDREGHEIERLRRESERLREELVERDRQIADLERQLALRLQNSTTSAVDRVDRLVSRNRDSRRKSRSAAPGSQGARSEFIGHK